MRAFTVAIVAVFASIISHASHAQMWPGADYDPAVPTLEAVLGYAPGEQITTHSDMLHYMGTLAAYAPDQVKIFEYGRTWEGRKLMYLAVSSPENIAKLDAFEAGMRRLADPRKTDRTAADALINDLPASLWLAYSVHGNEISSTDAALQTLYHLLAARGDDRVPEILKNSIVFINPLQNPDGRDRFIHRFRSAKGLEADSDRISAEHNEPWPSGRTNHYLFDLNRDWIVLTQPETRGHVEALQRWYPLVFVDLHEMGGDNSYYFAPEAIPYNPHLVESQRSSLFDFGRNNARWFDHFGRPYFTRDVYDAFYPGYGASWPAYYGAVAMTYEQASARGLVFRRRDGDEMTFRDTVMGHFITSLATAETVANNAKTYLRNFYDYQVSAVDEGRKADGFPRAYLFPGAADHARSAKLMSVLKRQGIEVTYAEEAFRACGSEYSRGTAVIDAAQPRARMIRTLLDAQVDMDADFVAEQERRRALNYDHDIYDVTGWSLPLQFQVDMKTCNRMPNISAGDVGKPQVVMTMDTPFIDGDIDTAKVFIIDAKSGAVPSAMAQALRAGLRFRMMTRDFTIGGKDYGRGSLVFSIADNDADLVQRLPALDYQVAYQAYGSSWVDGGADFGGRFAQLVLPPKIAMAWDDPTFSYSAGNSRFVIERQLGYPVTAIRTDDLARADLSRYDVLILPVGLYDRHLSGAAKALGDWVRSGGVLIGQGLALRYLTGDDVGLLSSAREYQAKDANGDAAGGSRVAGVRYESAEDARIATEPKEESPDTVPGVLVNAVADQDHWLTAGVQEKQIVLMRGADIYRPLTLDAGRNVLNFTGSETLLASGYIWDENRTQSAHKLVVMIEPKGRGFVIGFTQEPTVRAYLDGLLSIYANALFLAPSVARPVR